MIATAAELATYLGRAPFTGLELAQADLALELATGIISAELDQAIDEVVDDTVTLTGGRGGIELLLPELPVTSVSEVIVSDPADTTNPVTLTELADYLPDLGVDGRRGLLRRLGGRWPGPDGLVTVTYTHGYAAGSAPAALKAVALGLAARARNNTGGLTQETVGRWSATYAAHGLEPTANDRLTLHKFLPGARQ